MEKNGLGEGFTAFGVRMGGGLDGGDDGLLVGVGVDVDEGDRADGEENDKADEGHEGETAPEEDLSNRQVAGSFLFLCQ